VIFAALGLETPLEITLRQAQDDVRDIAKLLYREREGFS
jgi:hypothetical protein